MPDVKVAEKKLEPWRDLPHRGEGWGGRMPGLSQQLQRASKGEATGGLGAHFEYGENVDFTVPAVSWCSPEAIVTTVRSLDDRLWVAGLEDRMDVQGLEASDKRCVR
jgi:hypothetical protein